MAIVWGLSIIALVLIVIVSWGYQVVMSDSQAFLALQQQNESKAKLAATLLAAWTQTPGPTPGLKKTPITTSTTLKSSAILEIYQKGQVLGSDPHAFSKVGDCNSLGPYFLTYFDLAPSTYDLGAYTYFQPAIQQFNGSFNRKSLAVGDGFNTSAVLSPSRADPQQCNANESPLACEYRIQKPSFAIIAIGTDDYLSLERFEANLRQIVEASNHLGIVPILLNQMDNANQLGNNAIIAKVAKAYDLPLVDLMLAAQLLPNQGLADNIHPSGLTDAFVFSEYNLTHYGWPVRNLATLQALYNTWRSVSP
jgi:hypothetical protein